MRKLACLPLLSLAALVLSGCNSTSIGVSNYKNPPPEVAFSAYRSFELQELQMSAPYADQEANEKAKAKIQEELDYKLKPQIDAWNAGSGTATGDRGTLLIEPRIHEIKFIGGTARFWAGALAGDSAIVVKVAFRDKETGKIVAEPEFYQHANAYGGAWSIGGTDNAMLNRMGTLIADYTKQNYASPVGGMTGKPEPKK